MSELFPLIPIEQFTPEAQEWIRNHANPDWAHSYLSRQAHIQNALKEWDNFVRNNPVCFPQTSYYEKPPIAKRGDTVKLSDGSVGMVVSCFRKQNRDYVGNSYYIDWEDGTTTEVYEPRLKEWLGL